MKIALDTNVLAYMHGVNDAARGEQAAAVIGALPSSNLVIPVQVLGELCHVMKRKATHTLAEIRSMLLEWGDAVEIGESTHTAFVSALDLATIHGLQIWDALILAVAAQAGCRVLLSEDLQHGFTWGGTTVVNPFLPDMHPLLAGAMSH